MEIREFVDAKYIEKQQESICASLKRIFNGEVSSKAPNLSKENARIGLLFLNGFAEEKSKEQENYYYYGSIHSRQVDKGDKRFLALKQVSHGSSFWEGERFELLEFLFGKEFAPLIKQAWLRMPQLMYQTGYLRRSFRAPHLEDVTFTRQINFIITLLERLSYRFSFSEYIIYSNQIYNSQISHLIASALDDGDEPITALLLDIVYNRHEVGKVSGEIIKGMLLSQNEEAWEAVGKLLLSAQRQEGLRQVIVEQLDETSLGAMKYFIDLIIEHKLSRFSSVVRALDVWAGLGWEGQKENTVKKFLQFAHDFLHHPEKIEKAVLSRDNSEVYMALWTQGVFDVEKCLPLLQKLIRNTSQEKLLLAMRFASETGITSLTLPLGLTLINHEAPVVYTQAISLLDDEALIKQLIREQKLALFELLEEKLLELPKEPKVIEGKVFSWLHFSYSKEVAYNLMISLSELHREEDIEQLLPYFAEMPIRQRERISSIILNGFGHYTYRQRISNQEKLPALTQLQRDFAFQTLRDRSETVKYTALNALEHAEVADHELLLFEDMLKSKSANTRKAVINIILKKKPQQVQDSTHRLLASKSQDQRLAGLDLLGNLKKTHAEWVNQQAIAFSERKTITKKEDIILETLLLNQTATEAYTKANGFGLFDPKHTAPVPQQAPAITNTIYTEKTASNAYGLSMPASEVNRAIKQLEVLFLQHKDYEYTYEDWDGSQQTTLLGNRFESIKRFKHKQPVTAMERFQNLPLHEVWQAWYENSALTQSDLFLIVLGNGNLNSDSSQSTWSKVNKAIRKITFSPYIPQLGHSYWNNPLISILECLSNAFPYEGANDFLEGLVAKIFQTIPASELYRFKLRDKYGNKEVSTWRHLTSIRNIYRTYAYRVDKKSDEAFRRFWKLDYFYHKAYAEEVEPHLRQTSSLYNYARAHQLGLIGRDELFSRIMDTEALRELTHPVRKNQYDIGKEFPVLKELVAEAVPRLLAIELKRGDSETEVSYLVEKIGRVEGIDYLVQILQALGKDKLHRGYSYYTVRSKKELLSQLLKNCFPEPSASQKAFNKHVKTAKISANRLVEVAMYAPQWIDLITNYLGWREMKSAVWWLHAHTNGHHNSQTEAEFAKYSNIDATDFQQGAVDTRWFREIYKALGKAKWEALYKSAKYISEGNGHTRALLYADVILGNKKITEVTKRVKDKRNQDYLRVYGLVPLSKKNREKDLLKRYQFVQQFKKESKQFGSQRQASEAIAARIALENLARTAGFPDPIRLQWAMETEEAKQILQDHPRLTFDNVEIWLEIDEFGQSNILVNKEGKKLQSIPAKLRKEKAVVAMKKANKVLREQYRRTRKSLEMAMINGDEFLKSEIETLKTHPVVAPLLKKLVFSSDEQLGFLTSDRLVSIDGAVHPLGEQIRIAHCADLHEQQQWADYQKLCFERQLKQPFKQIFRELYIPTADELHEKTISRRYAGHQVQTNKTVALLKGQGWTVNYEEGLQKVFHQQGVMVQMFAMADWFSPADVESPTLETVQFFDRKTYKPIPFDQLDARVFSEAMRDLDLVVSVAHVGETDPEASQSTIELRAVIVEETARLFKLQNVTLSDRHAKIKGDLGEYSVHLGSGVSHKMPGVYLSILPVHSQHRGRMFLPFLDEDPKTAEIMSKVLLLAKDKDIQDPTILRQM